MAKRIRLNAFTQCSPCHQFKGMWKHPDDRTAEGYRSLDYWIELARLCERGLFDAIFFADVHGTYDVFGGDERVGIRHAVQIPGIDPTMLIPALAAATEHLGFQVTYSTTYHSPYQTAKVFSTLDHLTGGRVGWNIVTSYLESAAANGMGDALAHDLRYDRADEYLDVVTALWEQSWDDDAVVLDTDADVFTDPDRVHRINHEGEWFKVRGPHQVEPSPQRTPLLLQAGASPRGTEFAARHAEVVFANHTSIESCRAYVTDLRRQAEDLGRDPDTIAVLLGSRMLVGENQEDAIERTSMLDRFASPDGTLALWAGWTGIDLGSVDRSTLLTDVKVNGAQTIVQSFMDRDPERAWTLGDVADQVASTAARCRIWGGPAEVADQMEEWMEAGIDGFNIVTAPHPTGFEMFADHLVPELQRRGRYPTSYGPRATMRERYQGSPHLHPTHPATGQGAAGADVP